MGQKVFSAKEIEKKKNRVKVQLDQLQAMKRLLLEEGIKPDEADKERESKLIQQLLGFEKDLKRLENKRGQPSPASQKFSKARSRFKKGKGGSSERPTH